MPDLRILTWNSTGESVGKANELQNEVIAVNAANVGLPVNLILVQEAQNGLGAINNMLNPVQHITETLNGGGAGYIAKFCTPTAVVVALALHNYATDATFQNWRANASPNLRTIITNQAKNMRPPAYIDFIHQGASVRLITWHAPLGPPLVMNGQTMQGGGTQDGFLFLDSSALLQNVAAFDLVVVAGDLNATSSALSKNYGGYVPLDDFRGESSHVDHILAYHPAGGNVTFHEARATASTSVHPIFSCRIHW